MTIVPAQIILSLKNRSKKTIINELLDLLTAKCKLLNRDIALKALLDREQAMSTAMLNRIAIPHAKTTAIQELPVATGMKKSSIDFDFTLDDKSCMIILIHIAIAKQSFIMVFKAIENYGYSKCQT
jgi:PTS system fructose-specific IIC component